MVTLVHGNGVGAALIYQVSGSLPDFHVLVLRLLELLGQFKALSLIVRVDVLPVQ